MYRKSQRILAVLLIIAIAIGAGFLVDLLWTRVEEWYHPKSYEELVTQYATAYNVPEYVIYAVIKTESDFDPNATSSAGAVGHLTPMQNRGLDTGLCWIVRAEKAESDTRTRGTVGWQVQGDLGVRPSMTEWAMVATSSILTRPQTAKIILSGR